MSRYFSSDADKVDGMHEIDIEQTRQYLIGNYVITGLAPATSANLTSTISSGYAFVEGVLVYKDAESHTYNANKDTYIFIDKAGNYTFSEVNNGDPAPSKPANTTPVAKVVTDATSITSVVRIIDNTFVGRNAGFSNVSGYRNTFTGLNAGYNNTTGYSNTFVGRNAGFSNVSGYSNTFTGLNAGYNNTTGYNNTFTGLQAGFNNTTGYNNTVIGVNAGYNNTTGFGNTFVGVNAGRYISDGTTPNQTTSQSVFIGRDTKAKADGDVNEIVIGYNATGNGSNTVTLGDTSITDTYLRGTVSIGYDSADYGGNFATYTPPTGREGAMRIAKDTNATNPGQRLYVYIGGAWHYVDLT